MEDRRILGRTNDHATYQGQFLCTADGPERDPAATWQSSPPVRFVPATRVGATTSLSFALHCVRGWARTFVFLELL